MLDRRGSATTRRPRADPTRRESNELTIGYEPRNDGRADPGEVVWTWVPYEEDHSRGKDRPVLIIGHVGRDLAGLMLTSKDHDRDADQEAGHGRHWIDVGSGGWDRERRPSEVRLDRLIRVDPTQVRREGASLDKALFDSVVRAARRHISPTCQATADTFTAEPS
ncbi:MAG: type II toxin-antitoxin system PemK/MazF family toxin [Propionibacteriales bacterium]|nr:type II toxin-antitoxin system PemK/MazF family toxin [Propionibacteriales bacterium]